MKELNKINEKEALNNLLHQIKILIADSYDKSLEIATPKQDGKGNYIMDMKLKFSGNNRFLAIRDLLFNTLLGLELDEKEVEEYNTMNLNVIKYEIDINTNKNIGYNVWWGYLRNDKTFFDQWSRDLLSIIYNERSDYKIIDNNGKVWQSGSKESIKPLPRRLLEFHWNYGEYFGGEYEHWSGTAYIRSLTKNAMWSYEEMNGKKFKAKYNFVISYDSYENLQFVVDSKYMQNISKIDVVRK